MTGCLIFRHDEEMDDLSKSQFSARAGGPFVDAILCLPQYLVRTWWIDLLRVQENFPVKRIT